MKGENIAISANHGGQINCFGILSRENVLFSKTTIKTINADFIVEFFEDFSLKIRKQTVIVLDNARIHIAQKVKSDRRCGTIEILANKRTLHILFASLFATLKYY